MKSKTIISKFLQPSKPLPVFVKVDKQYYEVNDITFTSKGPTALQNGGDIHSGDFEAIKEEKIKAIILNIDR